MKLRLMLQGKVRAATRWLTERSKGSVLLPTDTVSSGSLSVVDALKLKHPSPHPPHSSTLLRPSVVPLFEDLDITGAHIGIIAHRIKGSAGPTGCDSTHWQDVLLRFGCQSQRLRDSLAGLCRRLANSIVDWLSIRALLANRLIALDKSPGIRPIGVGETLRRILGKTICLVSRDDVESVCEVSQLCGGLKCGIESAIHTANDLFQDNDVGMLVIDASNAFNSINRLSLLWNVRVLWPRASRFIFNTYRGWSPLIMKGCSTEILSMEGVTQGDPLSMFVYAIATIPLIHKLNHITGVTQLWYADDSSAIGDLPCLRMWLDLLIKYGPYYGYTPEPRKSSLVVKSDMVNLATSVFGDVGINVVTSCRFLGGIVGSSVGRDEFVSLKVDVWEQHVNLLSDIAKDQPQAAYVALTKSLQNEWSFLQRVVPHCGHHFQQVEKALASNFIPSLLGHDITPLDRDLFSLPVRLGGLGIRNPTTTADSLYSTSRHATQLLSNAIMGLGTYSFADHYDLVLSTRSDYLLSQEVIYSQVYDTIFQQSDSMTQRSLTRNKQSLSAWLTTLPILKDDFNLSSVEFRDALCLRYLKPLLGLPPLCDGCSAPFTTTHALDCRKGGLVIHRHNEIRDFFYDLSSLVWSSTIKEPVVLDGSLSDPPCESLIADFSARGVWQPQATALFDVRVIDTDAPSYVNKSPDTVLMRAEREKKSKYGRACEDKHATFTPLCISSNGH